MAGYFLVWYDDSRLTFPQKIQGGLNAYTERFKQAPHYILVNAEDRAACTEEIPTNVQIGPTLRRNTFWYALQEES